MASNYVGEIGQSLNCRINGHQFNIVHRRTEDSSIVAHFSSDNHFHADMTVIVIGHGHLLLTTFALGMNLRVDTTYGPPGTFAKTLLQ